jgi:hypothetical protein
MKLVVISLLLKPVPLPHLIKKKLYLIMKNNMKIQQNNYPLCICSRTALLQGIHIKTGHRFYSKILTFPRGINLHTLSGIRNPFNVNVKTLPFIGVVSTTTYLQPVRHIPNTLYHKSKYAAITIPNNKFLIENSIDKAVKNLKENNKVGQILKTNSNKEYTTFLTGDTKVKDISDSELIVELQKRELIKVDNNETSVSILMADNSSFRLGVARNKVKLSSLGQAYYEKLEKQSEFCALNPVFETSNLSHKFKIIIPPQGNNNLFIETGKEKHLLIVVDDQGNHFAFGYFTSKLTGSIISEQQFKKFQENKEGLESIKNLKDQRFHAFENLIKLNSEEIKVVKWQQEYIKTLTEESTKYLEEVIKEISTKAIICWDSNGVTREDCLKMCQEHDKVASTKNSKHPLTADQKKQNKTNNEKQKIKVSHEQLKKFY